jgi:hypothetical protein
VQLVLNTIYTVACAVVFAPCALRVPTDCRSEAVEF